MYAQGEYVTIQRLSKNPPMLVDMVVLALYPRLKRD